MTKREILKDLDTIIEILDRELDTTPLNYVTFFNHVNDEILRKILTLRDNLGHSLLEKTYWKRD